MPFTPISWKTTRIKTGVTMWGHNYRRRKVHQAQLQEAAADIARTEKLLDAVKAQQPEVEARAKWLENRTKRNHFAEAMLRTMGQNLEEEGR